MSLNKDKVIFCNDVIALFLPLLMIILLIYRLFINSKVISRSYVNEYYNSLVIHFRFSPSEVDFIDPWETHGTPITILIIFLRYSILNSKLLQLQAL